MTRYLVLGSGRWATHLQRLLTLSRVDHLNWNRQQHADAELEVRAADCTHLWIAVSDQAIAPLTERLRSLDKTLLHSSGALEIDGAHSVHPPMSFRPSLYDDDFYSRLAFVTTSTLPREQLIPGLANPLSVIPPEKKAFYHAMCVLAGNGSVLLWQKFFREMQDLGLPPETARQYCERVSENLLTDPATALTGPLVRGDRMTLLKNLNSLDNDPYQDVLQALIQAYHQESQRQKRGSV